jgi:hypothetical protein
MRTATARGADRVLLLHPAMGIVNVCVYVYIYIYVYLHMQIYTPRYFKHPGKPVSPQCQESGHRVRSRVASTDVF